MVSDKGLSLIELLIAIVILALVTVIVLPSLLNSFRFAKAGQRTLQITTEAQQLVETIKGQWQWQSRDPTNTDSSYLAQLEANNSAATAKYASNCVTVPLADNVSVKVLDLDASGTPIATTSKLLISRSTCDLPAVGPLIPMKRLTISITSIDGKDDTFLVLDVPRP